MGQEVEIIIFSTTSKFYQTLQGELWIVFACCPKRRHFKFALYWHNDFLKFKKIAVFFKYFWYASFFGISNTCMKKYGLCCIITVKLIILKLYCLVYAYIWLLHQKKYWKPLYKYVKKIAKKYIRRKSCSKSGCFLAKNPTLCVDSSGKCAALAHYSHT